MCIRDSFGFEVPVNCEGVPSEILDVKSTWKNPEEYDSAAENLVNLFKENFERYEEDATTSVIAAGPQSMVEQPDDS